VEIVADAPGGGMLSAMTLVSLKKNIEDLVCGNNVVFHHVPKCGGTSVYRALGIRYALSFARTNLVSNYAAIEALYPGKSPQWVQSESIRFREIDLLSQMYRDTKCIAGHFPFSRIAFERFNNKYKFITVLREPVAFFTSFYYWNVKAQQERWHIEDTLEAFLETPRARVFGEFYARFLGGNPTSDDSPIEQEVAQAKGNLAKFSAIGFTDDMESFNRRLSDVLGIRIRIGHENKSEIGSADRVKQMPSNIRQKIEKISASNFEVYDFCRGCVGK
jgi:hypothetical protein